MSDAAEQIRVNHSGQSATTFVVHGASLLLSLSLVTASASLTDVGDVWFVNRVIAPEPLSRQHTGTKLLKAAIDRALLIRFSPKEVSVIDHAQPALPVCCVILRLRGLDTTCGRGVQVRVEERGYCTEHAKVYVPGFVPPPDACARHGRCWPHSDWTPGAIVCDERG